MADDLTAPGAPEKSLELPTDSPIATDSAPAPQDIPGAADVQQIPGATAIPKPVPAPLGAPEMDREPASSGSVDTDLLNMAKNLDGTKVAAMKQNLFATQDQNPDSEAQVQRLAAKYGVSPDFIRPNLAEYQHADSAPADDDLIKFAKKSPKLAAFVAASPSNAALVKDDMPAQQKVESMVQRYSTMQQMGNAWNAGLANLYSGIAKIPALALDSINALGATASVTGEPSIPVPDSLRSNSFTQLMDSEAKALNAQAPKMAESVTGDIADGNYAKAGQAFAVQLAHSAPTLAAIIGSSMVGQPEVGIGLTAGGAGAESESAAIEKGIDPNVAAPLGLAHAAIFAAMSEIKIGALDGAVAKWSETFGQDVTREVMQKFAGTLAYNATKMGAQMAVAHGADQFADYISGVNPDAFQDFGKQTADTFLAGAGTGFFLEGAGGLNAMHENARQAGLNRDFYTALGSSVEGTKLRERMPEAQQQIIQSLTKDGPVENIYIQPEVFNQKVPEALKMLQDMGLSKAYSDAKAAGTDMKIPLADWTNKFVGSPQYEALKDDIKFDPGQMSVNENEAALKEHDANQASMQEIAAPQPPSPLEEEGSRLQQNLQDKLEAAGQSKAQAKAGSEQMVAFFRTHAENFGTSIADIANTAKVPDVQGEKGATQVPPGGETYNQTSPIAIENQLQNNFPIADQIPKAALKTDKSFEGITPKEIRKISLDDAKNNIQRGKVTNDHTGWDINVSGEGLKKTANQNVRPEQAIALKNIDELIKNGTYLRSEADRDGNPALSHDYLYSPFSHDGKSYIAKIDLKNSDRGRTFYSLHVQELNDASAGSQTISPQLSEASTTNKADLLRSVNEARQTTRLFQSGEKSPLGQVSFFPDGESIIKLFKSQNASTFAHESGHVYLDALGKLVERSDAPEQVKNDYQSIREFLGAKDGEKITEAQHEQFAESFTKYLMEGKAPSARLEGTFERFKNWLTQLYQKASGFFGKAEITPQIRDVFDRLLATPEEISEAQKNTNQRPLFDDPKSVGMNDVEAKKYGDAIANARQSAETDLSTRLMQDIKREQTRDWQTQLEGVKADVAKEIDARPEQQALAALTRGTEPDGEPLPDELKIKIDKQSIIDQFGKERLGELPRVYSKEGGVYVDQVADLFGFKSGDELLTALSNAGDRDQLINDAAESRMKDMHGDVMTDGRLYEQAVKAVHNNDSSALMQAELKHLASEDFAKFKGLVKKIARAVPTVEDVRAQAEDQIDRTLTKDIQPNLFQRAEQKSAKAAVDAFLKGDFEGAFDAKKKQLLAHELYRAAANAKDEVSSIVDFMNTFSKSSVRERMGKAGGNYLEQVDNLLDRFEFKRSTSLSKLDDRKSLLQFVQSQTKMGYDIQLPDKLLNEANKQSYKETSFEDLKDIRDTAERVKKLAYLKDQLLANEKFRSFTAARDEVKAQIEANYDITPKQHDFRHPIFSNIVDKGAGFVAAHTKMEFFFRAMDGYKANGTAWNAFFKPFADASSEQLRMMRESNEALNEIWDRYSLAERSEWRSKTFVVPEAETEKTKGLFNKANLLSIALNTGNAENLRALKEGYGWSDVQLQKVLKNLDARDWETVQKIWDHVDTFWPHIAEMERRLNGVAPGKVEAQEFTNEHGTFRGGYYPLKADADIDPRTRMLSLKSETDSLFGGGWARAQTAQGHTIEREGFGGKPVDLSLDVLTNHLTNVIHDLTHREAIIDTHKLVNDPAMRETITNAFGKQMYQQLNPWLATIAGDFKSPSSAVEKAASASRSAFTTMQLGWKVTSGLKHTLSYLTAADELGPKYALEGLKVLSPQNLHDSWDFISSRSEEMRARGINSDRDLRDMAKKMGVADSAHGPQSKVNVFLDPAKRSMFTFMGYMDLATSMPAWMGAYSKAMDGNVENIDAGNEKDAIAYADSLVRRTKGSGEAKDLSQIHTGGEAVKNFTMFYSLMNLRFNNLQSMAGEFKLYKDVPKLAASMALMYVVPAFLENAIVGRGPSDEDKKHLGKYAAFQLAKYPMESMVFTRELAQILETKKAPDAQPLSQLIYDVGMTGSAAVQRATGEKSSFNRGDMHHAVDAAGFVSGIAGLALPTRQMLTTGEYLKDWMSGIERPTNPADALWRGLVTGSKKK